MGVVLGLLCALSLSPKKNQEHKVSFSSKTCLSLASFTEPIYKSLASAKLLPIGFVMMNRIKLSTGTINNGYLLTSTRDCFVLSLVHQTEALSPPPSASDAEPRACS